MVSYFSYFVLLHVNSDNTRASSYNINIDNTDKIYKIYKITYMRLRYIDLYIDR